MAEAEVIRDYTDRITGATVRKGSVIEVTEERLKELVEKRKVREVYKYEPPADTRVIITDPGQTDNKKINEGTGDNKMPSTTNPPPPPPATGTATSGAFNPPPPPPATGTATSGANSTK